MKASQWSALKDWAFVVVGMAIGISLLVYPHESHRRPASIPSKPTKLSVLEGHSTKHLRTSGKGNGLVELAIAAPNKVGVSQGTVIELEATVEARADLSELKYLWIMPKDGAHVVSGEAEGVIGNLAAGSQTKLHLSVMSDTDENRQVHLHVYRVVNGENMGNMAQYNTVNQEAIEWLAKDKSERLKAEAAKAGHSTVNKIYQ